MAGGAYILDIKCLDDVLVRTLAIRFSAPKFLRSVYQTSMPPLSVSRSLPQIDFTGSSASTKVLSSDVKVEY